MNQPLLFDILSVLLLLFVAFIIMKLNKPYVVHQQFDEMQMMFRLKAYQTAFFTCILLLLIAALFLQVFKQTFIQPVTLLYAILIITVGVFANLCILNGSYDAINQTVFWMFTMINGISSFMIIFVRRTFIVNGQIGSGLITLLMFLLYLSISVSTLIRKKRDQAEKEEE